ncbi:hypothetical protein NHH03_12115 [Stieleria sp. TO1_6]|uniref:hypothetical protein n=1 Tax=Stieleria tagensis TaxID=2956795 RepID=UPI00209AC5E3|nr:hypothetical protein [Stieleria tagensis]MCO8122484.1 hypothetical protein [Stieleria tagensis]
MVGSHPRCDIQIEDSRLPSVVYLVVIHYDRIEAWPTCPLAFPIWGRISKNHVLLVGKTRLQFFLKDDSPDTDVVEFESDLIEPVDAPLDVEQQLGTSPVPEIADPDADLVLDWGSGPKQKSLNRNISILGEDHPSLIRLHRAHLHRCDHGVVCFGEDVWLIDLHPEHLSEETPIIRHVRPGDPSVVLGGVHLWITGSEESDIDHLVKSARPIKSFEPLATTISDDDIETARTNTSEQNVAVVQAGSDDKVESLELALTERFLKKNAKQSFRRRALKFSAMTILSLAALSGIAVILTKGVLPMVRTIYQD